MRPIIKWSIFLLLMVIAVIIGYVLGVWHTSVYVGTDEGIKKLCWMLYGK